MRGAPLPDDFRTAVFRVHDAREAGVSRNRLYARDLERPIRGVRRSTPAHEAFTARLEAYAARLRPDAFFSHSTAALILGIPIPLALERAITLHIAVLAPDRAPHAAGIDGHRLAASTRVITHRGFRVTSPADTWRDLASQLTMIELVAAGDGIIFRRSPMATPAELALAAANAGHRRGSVSLRAAVPFLNERSESPPESELRVILALGGMPEPRVNYEVVQTSAGSDARVDFAYKNLKFAIEYQGDYHRSKNQWRKDMTRRTRLESQGWYVMELNADDLRSPGELISRIRTSLARRR